MEDWKIITNWEDYSISKYGYVKNNNTNKILSNITNHNGYLVVHLHKRNINKLVRINRLVAKYFCFNMDNLEEVNHENGIKFDNFYRNLKYCTRSYNMQHAIRTGLVKRHTGEKATAAILTKESVIGIFTLKGIYTTRIIANQYNVSTALVSLIQQGKHRLLEIQEVIQEEEILRIVSIPSLRVNRGTIIEEITLLGKVIREYTIKELAKELNLSVAYISQIASGKRGRNLSRSFRYKERKVLEG